MEISIKSSIQFGSIIFTGLSAGLFFAWSVSVIPGTQKLLDLTYLETMQSINRAILNPVFFTVFFGTAIFLSLTSIYEYHSNPWAFGLFLAASIIYLIGTIGVTGLGNVPLNQQLELLNLAELQVEKIESFRKLYETNWNRLHLIRTICAFLALVLTALAVIIESK
jgi:uncharacterized membrane protein